jgi:hypothetical protein
MKERVHGVVVVRCGLATCVSHDGFLLVMIDASTFFVRFCYGTGDIVSYADFVEFSVRACENGLGLGKRVERLGKGTGSCLGIGSPWLQTLVQTFTFCFQVTSKNGQVCYRKAITAF